MSRLPFFIPLLAALLFSSGLSDAAEEAVFDAAKGAPAEQGWRRSAAEASELEGAEEGAEPAWRIGGRSSTVTRIIYVHSLVEVPMKQEPWSAEAVVRVVEASQLRARDAFLEVMDGVSQWALCLVRTSRAEGIGYVRPDGSCKLLGPADLQSGFGTLKATYNPESSSVEVRFNEALLGVLTRADVPPVAQSNQKRIAWGDNNGAAFPDDARAESYWRSVRFIPNP